MQKARAATETLSLPELEHELFHEVYCYTATDQEQETLRQLWGFTPKTHYLPNFLTLMRALSEKKGISYCGRFDRFVSEPSLKYYPLPAGSALAESQIVAIWRVGDISPLAAKLLDLFPDEAKGDESRTHAAPREPFSSLFPLSRSLHEFKLCLNSQEFAFCANSVRQARLPPLRGKSSKKFSPWRASQFPAREFLLRRARTRRESRRIPKGGCEA